MTRNRQKILAGILAAAAALVLGWYILHTADPHGSAVSGVQMYEYNKNLQPEASTDHYRTTYEIFVGSFRDSNGDGTGDLNGIREKLDYIQDTGFDQLWLTPVMPSRTYHKYDVDDYLDIDPAFGTLDDYRQLLNECHERGITVLLDLPVNHSSSAHPWFVQASDYLRTLSEGQEPDISVCPYVDYYHFSRTKGDGYAPLGDTGWFYEARFWSEMPDLNLDSDAVKEEIRRILSFWIDLGVDGFRLDAVTSYYTGNPDANTDFLEFMCSTCRSLDPDCYIVAEAWTDRNNIAKLYESGVDSLFNFPFADNGGLIRSVMNGTLTGQDFVSAMISSEELYSAANPDYIDAPFYTNHDTARSAGFYALDDGPQTKMAYALSLFMTGDSFVYYGEEIGMKGSGKDENKRMPMLWSNDPAELCTPPDGADDVKMKFAPLDEQMEDPLSLYHWFKEVIRVRNSFPVIARGRTAAVDGIDNTNTAVFIRWKEGMDPVLVAMNVTAEEQAVDLNVLGEPLVMAAVLNTTEENIRFENGTVVLPAYSIAVFTEEH